MREMNGCSLQGITGVWRHTLGDPRVCIAILDGPVDLSHPSLRGARLTVAGRRGRFSVSDAACAHGTHVSSLIFAQHGTGPVRGVAPRCRGIVIPVFSGDPTLPGAIRPCAQSDLARAIEAAVGYGARVVNVSAGQLGHPGTADVRLIRAVELCARRGVLIVAAAGNDGCDCLHLPAALPSILTVGAHGDDGLPSRSSNFGRAYQRQGVVAPGLSILGATPGGRYARLSGTSFAAPLVAGLAGLLISAKLSRGGNFAASDAREIHDALLRSAAACDLDDRRACRRLLAGRVLPAEAFALYMKEVTRMNQLEKPEPSLSATDAAAANDLTQPPVDTAIQGSSCGCSTAKIERPGRLHREADEPDEYDAEFQRSSEEPPRSKASGGVLQTARPAQGLRVSGCECQKSGGLAFAVGELSYDFGTQANLDAIQSEMIEGKFATSPYDLLDFLLNRNQESGEVEEEEERKQGGKRPAKGRRRTPPEPPPEQGGTVGTEALDSPNLHFAMAILWTLNQDETPIYVLRPQGAFARETYVRLLEFFDEQLATSQEGPKGEIIQKAERVSVPGIIQGSETLLSGQSVPVLVPDLRAMFNWSTGALIRAVIGEAAYDAYKIKEEHESEYEAIRGALDRIYYDLQNTGQTPQDRALNFAATKAFLLGDKVKAMSEQHYQLDEISVERSEVCRDDRDCWNVQLIFFSTENPLAQRKVTKFAVDVSGIIPVQVGPARSWAMR
jgi:hypothetical protein